ncbi:MAG: hypothetical protein JNM80_06925 [Phycisphaerae bacterium]|nr:hypothetical protein [Phycisphaerae bacterium]
MRRPIILAVAAVFVLAVAGQFVTYTVRFTENAVLTTFGSAGPDAKKDTPGLRFKWPGPIQTVTKYDTRSRFLQTKSETQQTADSRQLVVEAYCTYKVADPLRFFQRFSNEGPTAADHFRKAEDVLRGALRAAMAEISKYRMTDLFAPQAGASKLPELEARVLATLRASGGGGSGLDAWGIIVEDVGINRIVMPEETTRAVFSSMKEDRNRLIKELESKGGSQAQTIINTARTNASRIEEFAKSYASEIRRKGDEEAQQYVRQMNENPELAVFLRNIEFIRQSWSKRMTLVLSTGMPGFELFNPSAIRRAGAGKVPGVDALMGATVAEPKADAGGVQ